METGAFLTRPQAAEYLAARGLPVAKSTLQKWATTGGGPPYRIFGNKALYTPPELDEWAEQKFTPSRCSTSEVAA